MTHGIYVSVLTPEEVTLREQMELGSIDDELRLCRIRLLRAMTRENEAQDAPELEAREETRLSSPPEPGVPNPPPAPGAQPDVIKSTYKRRDYAAVIDRMLARIESLERTRAELTARGEAAKAASGDSLTSREALLREIAAALPD